MPTRPSPARPFRPQRPQPVRALSPAEEETARLARKRDAIRRWYAAKSPEGRAEFERWHREECIVCHPLADLYRIVPAGEGWWKAIHPFDFPFTFKKASSVVKATATAVVAATTQDGVRALMREHHPTWKEHEA